MSVLGLSESKSKSIIAVQPQFKITNQENGIKIKV